MQWLSLHDHVAGGQNSDVEHFNEKKCGLSRGLFFPPPVFLLQMNERQFLLQYKLN